MYRGKIFRYKEENKCVSSNEIINLKSQSPLNITKQGINVTLKKSC